MNKKLYCYILRNTHEPHKKITYNGFTNNIKRRIRQHNQEIKGGAKLTHKYGNKTWLVYAVITGFPNYQNALKCEWRIKKPDNKRRSGRKYRTPTGRIKGLNEVLKLDYWTRNSVLNNRDMNITVWIENGFAHLLTNLPSNINIIIVDKIDLDKI